MLTTVEKSPKVALCRVCRGTGHTLSAEGKEQTCTLCEGSGRVTVSCCMTLDIRPYRPRKQK